jgi:hypothetical protein
MNNLDIYIIITLFTIFRSHLPGTPKMDAIMWQIPTDTVPKHCGIDQVLHLILNSLKTDQKIYVVRDAIMF